jgi:hypothetical protein
MRTTVKQQTIHNKIVEKSVILPKTIQLKMDFEVNISAWVPVAKANKPMPQLSLTLSVGLDNIRLNANSADEIIDCLGSIMVHLENNKDVLDKKVREQQLNWLQICQELHEKTLRGMTVVKSLKSA